MNLLSKYIIVYIIALIFGWVLESILAKRILCFNPFSWRCVIQGLFLNGHIYGLLLITVIYQFVLSRGITFDTPSTILGLFVVILIFISLFECFMGKISYKYHGIKTWNYDNKFRYTSCDGYISVYPTLFFSLILLVYLLVIYPLIFND